MSYRKCAVCDGNGYLWLSPMAGIKMQCWQCLGKGEVMEDKKGDINEN